jgi:streptogramin lyase
MFMAVALLAVALFGLSPLAARAQVYFVGTRPIVVGSGFSSGGVAVDAYGDVFVADIYNGDVKEIVAVNGSIPANPTINVLGSGFNEPFGVAVDAAGDVFVGDTLNNAVKEIVAVNGSIPATNPTINVLGSGFSAPLGVAVDAAGDVFVADQNNSAVKEMVAVNGSIPTTNPTINVLGSGFKYPAAVAVDAYGDVFVADYGNGAVKVMVAVNGSIPATNPTILTLGSGFREPAGVAVDAAGDVFVADHYNSEVKEMMAYDPTILTLGSGFSDVFGLAVDAQGDLFVGDSGNSAVKEIQAQSVNFGTANVCPSGQTTPAPCSKILTLNFYVARGTTIGSVKFFTSGAANLDFQAEANDRSKTLCFAQTYASATTCTLDVTFAPLAPGERKGAVQILDGSGNVLANTYIYGIGTGPAVAFSPSNTVTLGSGFSYPTGAAVDAAGDVFVADYGARDVKEIVAVNGSIPANPTILTLGSGFNLPIGVAVDAAGDVFVADTANNAVKQIVAVNGSIPATNPTINVLGSGFYAPYGVAVDAAGDVFVADTFNNAVKEILAAGGYSTVLTLGSGFHAPTGVAVDAAGDVFVADQNNSEVKEILAVNGSIPANPTINVLGSGFNYPAGVAVDAAGDVFVADGSNSAVKEIVAVNGSIPATNPTILTLGSGFSYTAGVALDAAGDVFVADYNNSAVKEITRSQPPSLSFASTNVGSTSSDSPQAVQFENIGNAPLVAKSLTISANFKQVDGSGTLEDCAASGFTLDPGAECNLSIDFTPQSAGALSGTATLTDNALNAGAPNYAKQVVSLSGTGVASKTATTTALASSANPSSFGESVTFTATVTASSGPTPTGTVNFYHLTTLLGSGTLSGGVATFTTSKLPLYTTHIHAVYLGSADDAGSTSATIAQVVLYSTKTTLTSSPNPSTVGQAVTFKATVTAAAGATPTGTVDFYHYATLLGSGTLSGGVATFTTSKLPQATSHIHAVYVGSSTDETSTSATIAQVVNP